MKIDFQIIDWVKIDKVEYAGEIGFATWQTAQFGGLRIRRVIYSPGYIADHWCKKGHIVQCLKGSLVSILENGQEFELLEGMTYVVSNNLSSHKSKTLSGVSLLIIDGDFLK